MERGGKEFQVLVWGLYKSHTLMQFHELLPPSTAIRGFSGGGRVSEMGEERSLGGSKTHTAAWERPVESGGGLMVLVVVRWWYSLGVKKSVTKSEFDGGLKSLERDDEKCWKKEIRKF